MAADRSVEPTEVHAARVDRAARLYGPVLLLFLLALAYRFFDTLSRVLLIAYGAAILAVALNALVRRIPVKRPVAVGALGIASLAAIGAALWFGGGILLRQMRGLVDALPMMEAELEAWGDLLRAQIGLDVDIVGGGLRERARSLLGNVSGSDVIGRAGGLVEALAVPVLIFFGALFALAKPNERLLVPLLRAVPASRREAFRRMFTTLGERLTGWIEGQLVAMATIGVLATVAFTIIGVPYALLLGVLNGIAEFVPIVGPWVGGIPAVIVAFLDEPSKGLWTLVAILAMQLLESQIVTPLVMSRAADVHPFVTLFAIILFGGLFGFLGVLLALPLVLLVWTVVEVLWVEETIGSDRDRIEPVVEE